MDEGNDYSMFIDPEILKKELVISLPVLNESDIEMLINGADSSSDDGSSLNDRENEKPSLKRDQRRLNLLNNPDYGIILCFMQKFRPYINTKDYPLRIFEDNLINEQQKISRRFIDFHINLLKKLAPGRPLEHEQFLSSMTRFAYRFNRDDGEHLEEYGYAKARIDVKLRILKNLFEIQFDRNPPLKTAIADKPPFDIRSKPFGRDRFGASYWLFMDNDCFIRLFRENIDTNRTWTFLAKSQNELEKLIKILITDHIIRKKFPEWKFSYESFQNLSSSNEFEELYEPNFLDINDNITGKSSPLLIQFRSDIIKTEHIDLDPIVNLSRDLPSSPLSSFIIHNIDLTSDRESINSTELKGNGSNIPVTNDTRDPIYSPNLSQETNNDVHKNDDIEDSINKIQQQHLTPIEDNNITEPIISKPSLEQGIKRKLVDYDDTESEIEDSEKNDTPSQDSHQIPVNRESKKDSDLPIALRRSKRGHRTRIHDLSPDSSSTSNSLSQSSVRKKSVNDKWRNTSQSSKTNGRQRHHRRGKKITNDLSSTTSDEHIPTDDDDDLSEDYLPNNKEFDELLNGELLDEEDDDNDYIPHHTAKTAAKYYEQLKISFKKCTICLQCDRPELLLLCENCDDAYHLECVKPELLAIPLDDWYCPLCEHKRLCDNLIEKLLIFIKDQEQYEIKRKSYVAKRRKHLKDVMVNVERYVQPIPTKRQTNGFISSDDTGENESVTNLTNNNKNINTTTVNNNNTINNNNNNDDDDDDDDDDSVYGRKNDENRKPLNEKEEQTGKRRMRSCRQKPKNYSFDDYDKKIKEAMISAGINKELVEIDSDEDSDDMIIKRKSAKKRARYERDEDFDVSDGKNDEDFVPRRRRVIHDDSLNDDSRIDDSRYDDSRNDDSRYDDSRNDAGDNDDIGMSDDDSAWRNRRQSSVSSITKKKSTPKSNRNNRRKSPIVSDEDTIPYDPNINDIQPEVTIKTEPTTDIIRNEFNSNVFGNNGIVTNTLDKAENIQYAFNKDIAFNNKKRQRPKRAAVVKKKCAIEEESISDEDGEKRPPPPKHKPSKKRRGSNDSSIDNDDDYEKAAHKRRLFSHGRAITRTSITKHIKKLVGDEEDEDEEENEEESPKDKNSDETEKDKNNNSKQNNKNSEYDTLRLSDDDDFPDEQEILKTTGLINLKKPVTAPKIAALPVPYMPTVPSYQFAMIDPTAHFDFTCQPEPSTIQQPSDSNQANGDNNASTTS